MNASEIQTVADARAGLTTALRRFRKGDVTPAPDATLFDLAQFELDMEQLLGRKVEVKSSRALDPATDSRLLSDAIPL